MTAGAGRDVKLVYLGVGSNLGDREANLAAAAEALSSVEGVVLTRRSRLYDTLAVGPPQPRFLNAVWELQCALSPRQLLRSLQAVEESLGRIEKGLQLPRTVDLDVLLFGECILEDTDFQLPHAQMHTRRFVLEPLAELAPEARHPILGRTIREQLAALPPGDVFPVGTVPAPGPEKSVR
jgi:2-amino-4-hydroxy-6-hydroxymethyldihydropteridine diphosphokinase